MKAVFFGSDQFSLYSLKACFESCTEISLIVTTPARPQGRGLTLIPTPVQKYADEHSLPCIAPGDLKDPSVLESVKNVMADVFVVSSYGKYIPSAYLGIPKIASLNVHPSLLPLYRGSSPIQFALLNGDSQTGVSIIEVAKKLDAGDIFKQVSLNIEPDDDHISLSEKLGRLSCEVLKELLLEIPKKGLDKRPQDEASATYARKLTKEDAALSLNEEPQILSRKIKAFRPWPGSYIPLGDTRLFLLEAEPLPGHSGGRPGTLLGVETSGGIVVSAGGGKIRFSKVQLAGKKPTSGRDFVNGRRLKTGCLLEDGFRK